MGRRTEREGGDGGGEKGGEKKLQETTARMITPLVVSLFYFEFAKTLICACMPCHTRIHSSLPSPVLLSFSFIFWWRFFVLKVLAPLGRQKKQFVSYPLYVTTVI
jgi:hypothetical protein